VRLCPSQGFYPYISFSFAVLALLIILPCARKIISKSLLKSVLLKNIEVFPLYRKGVARYFQALRCDDI
jgi:hypothetical protein